MSPRRGLDPHKALEISLIATVDRDSYDGVSRDESIERLRQRAGGRSYLLAKAAGHYLGQFLAYGAVVPDAVEFAARLIAAGADLEQVRDAADEVRANAESGGY